MMTIRLTTLMLAALVAGIWPMASHAEQRTLFDFDRPDEAQRWQNINDGVMGGRSTGLFKINRDQNLEFYGTLSLANNGGFASVRARGNNMALAKDDVIVARIKGDGREYRFNVYDRQTLGGFSYRQTFKTKKNQWMEVRLPVPQFVASWRGMVFRNRKLNPASVTGLGFLIADKKSGPFKLEVDWIKVESATGAAGDRGEPGNRGADDIVDVAVKAGSFKTLIAAAKAAGLAGALKSEGPLTVFAPTDEAFSKLPKGTVASLLKPENKSQLIAILKYHIVPARVTASQASKVNAATTMLGQELEVTYLASSNPSRVPSKLLINDANVIKADIAAANGVIHVIDRVLMPKAMTNQQIMTAIEKAVDKGVPMYNHGDRKGCAKVYEMACRQILASAGKQSSGHVMQTLRLMVKHAEGMDDASHKSWALRHGMDYTYRMLQYDAARNRSAKSYQ